MNNPEPTDMKGTQIRDLIDMVQKRMGIDLESLSANPDGNLVSGSTFAIAPSARHATNFAGSTGRGSLRMYENSEAQNERDYLQGPTRTHQGSAGP
jgi:hypothetical protein